MAAPQQTTGIVALSRVLVAAAAELAAGMERAVVGTDKVRTAQGNAWAAIQEDRARARARDEMTRTVAAIVASGPRPARHRVTAGR